MNYLLIKVVLSDRINYIIHLVLRENIFIINFKYFIVIYKKKYNIIEVSRRP